MAPNDVTLAVLEGIVAFLEGYSLLGIFRYSGRIADHLSVYTIQFTIGYCLPFSFQASHVLDEAELILLDVKKREAEQCSALFV